MAATRSRHPEPVAMSQFTRILPAILLCLPICAGAAGALDCSFGTAGVVNRDFGSIEAAREVRLQSDGRIVTVGSAPGQIRLTRFLATGALDSAFAGGGSIVHAFAGSGEYMWMNIDGLGRIVVAGTVDNPDIDVFVARFTSAGAIDTSFGGGDGWLSFDFDPATSGAGRDGVAGIAIDAGNRIVVAGWMDANGNIFNPSNSNQAIARVTSSGVLDTSFGGGDGLALASSPGSSHDDDARSIAIDSLGRIVLNGGTSFGNTFNSGPRSTILSRWTDSGVLDTSFDGDGVLILDLSQSGGDDFGIDLTFDASNRLMVLGVLSDDPAIARVLDNGSLDTSFGGGDGIVHQSFLGGQDVTENILMQADGKFIVTGWPPVAGWFHFASMRFNSAGTLDTTWGTTGLVMTTIASNERAYAAVLQPDQNLILAGGVNNDTNMGLARYLNDGQGNSGTTTTLTAHTPDPSWPGQSVQVGYSVSAAAGGTPAGNVTVSDGVNSCTASVAAGSCNVALATLGTRQLTATYAGQGCAAASVSAPVAHSVQNIPFTITPAVGVGGSLAPATAQIVNGGQPTSFQLTVDPGYRLVSISGCGGVLNGSSFNIAMVTGSCTVSAVFNRNPVANAAQFTVLEDSGMHIGNLSATDDDPLVFSLVTNATRGNAMITNSSSGAYTYAPNANANGADSFSFRVSDGVIESVPANIGIDITPVNDAPSMSVGVLPMHALPAIGAHSVAGFASFDAGPADEDANQSLVGYEIISRVDPDGVVAGNGASVSIGNNGTIDYLLTGIGGTATFGVRARDNGGTANAGIEVSATQSFSIQVERSADLQIAKSDLRGTVSPGQNALYIIVVANDGPNAVTGAALVDALPANLINANWTCIAALSSSACPVPASGTGNLNTLVDLPADTFMRFEVSATVNAAIGDTVINTATLTTPEGTTELDAGSNSATDQNSVVADAVFVEGFEEAGSVLTVAGAAEALR
jgi:uncharacterized delta-60 repeat protein/uncharacterized repeat protein (TIGR01451 family)